jgi:hypothetical protein
MTRRDLTPKDHGALGMSVCKILPRDFQTTGLRQACEARKAEGKIGSHEIIPDKPV